jgi:hypothetical protein
MGLEFIIQQNVGLMIKIEEGGMQGILYATNKKLVFIPFEFDKSTGDIHMFYDRNEVDSKKRKDWGIFKVTFEADNKYHVKDVYYAPFIGPGQFNAEPIEKMPGITEMAVKVLRGSIEYYNDT